MRLKQINEDQQEDIDFQMTLKRLNFSPVCLSVSNVNTSRGMFWLLRPHCVASWHNASACHCSSIWPLFIFAMVLADSWPKKFGSIS